jgi:dipeptidyl aminopeptidase/acylaminoacyl peptidase
MHRDLRDTPLYHDVEEFYRRAFEPAFGRISGAADPHPSVDGRSIAFTGTKLEKLEGTPITRICVADAGAGTFEEVTSGPNDDRLPRWSPDGSKLAFLSDRAEKGKSQLYLLDRERVAEARAPAAVEGTVEYFSWSPDGRSILMGVAGTGAELAGVQGSGMAKEEPEELPDWVPLARSSADREGWRRAWVLDPAEGEARPASREGLNVWECVWCGPNAIAAIVSDGPREDLWYTAPLVLIDPESGKEREVYRGAQQLGWPAASPSGGRLAVVEALCSDRWVVAGDVVLIDPESGEHRRVDTMGVDVTALAWRDEDHLLFAGLRGMRSVAGELDAATGVARELWATDESWGFLYPDVNPVPDRDALTVVLQSYDRYPELAVIEAGTARTVLSFRHDGGTFLRERAGRIQTVTWQARDGLEIEGLLVRPDPSGPHPLVVLVHGGPVAATVNRWTMRGPSVAFLVSRGYAILFPNPRGSSGRGQAFAEMVYGDMGGGDANDILAGIDAMVERGVADPERVGVTGGSYGGFMSCWLPTQSERFAASVALSPVTDWYSQHLTSNIGFWDQQILGDRLENPGGEYFARSPVVFAHRVRTPTLLTAGLEDRCTPPGQAVEFYQALVDAGVEAELSLYPGEGHGVRKLPAALDLLTRMAGWFERHMPPEAQPPAMTMKVPPPVATP